MIFNVAFVAPLLLISLTLATQLGSRAQDRLRLQLDRRAGLLIPGVLFAVALALIVVGAVGLLGE